MGWTRRTLATALLSLAGCGAGGAAQPEASAALEDPVLRAVAVWEQGAEAIRAAPEPAGEGDDAAEPARPSTTEGVEPDRSTEPPAFRDFDERTRRFLASPFVVRAVPFGCAVTGSEAEYRVEAGLDDADAEVRLRALVVLMKVRAPRTVPKQWAVLDALRNGPRGVEFAQVTTRLASAFSPEALDLTLAEPPPGDRYRTPPAYQWALRAAGVTGHRGALGRLTELSRCDALDASLAAERSLEDFPGPEGDEALARCVDGWQFDAALRAAQALLGRDPERLRETLLASSPPRGMAYWKGVYLARLDDRRAVPILCAEMPGLAIIDGEMFEAIGRLAGPEDLDLVEALPARVREDQQQRAQDAVAAVRSRLNAAR